MKKLLFVAAFFSALAFIGCKSNATNGNPTEVLSAFFDAMAKKDMATVKELCTPESQQMISIIELGLKDTSSKETEKYDKSKVEFGTAVITGDNAKVPVKYKESGETTNFPLKKINGQWKVAFDKSSMMEMGMDKMKEGGADMNSLTDSLSKGMDEMKKMNVDSMMDKVKQGIDSVK
jgi:hypothetical protein